MPLVFIRKLDKKDKSKKFSFKAWYQKNKQRLSEKRAKRYAEDPVYKAAALRRSKNQKIKKLSTDFDGYTVSMSDAAEKIGVSVWVLREWRKKDYFPEPKLRGGRFFLRESQVDWLCKLKAFFDANGTRTSFAEREPLEQLIALVYANW